MNPEDIKREMKKFDWYHTVELAPGIVTAGQYDHRPLLKHYGIPADLTGKTVLDVGPAHGFFAFEFEKRGAEVATVELPQWSDHDGSTQLKASFEENDLNVANEPYLHNALEFAIKVRNSNIKQHFYTIYDISPSNIGLYDITFCGSLLIHLTDPLRALYALQGVTRDYAIIATVIDAARFGGNKPRAYFHGTVNGQAFWAPNMACLEQWALAAGFKRIERVSTFPLKSLDGQFDVPHGTIKAYVN